jgi:hypothetical protein
MMALPRLRVWLRLNRDASPTRMVRSPKTNTALTLVTDVIHRFEESIAGRSYLIEVAAVSPDRWRAYIVRAPGVRSALMPFYGETPDEAAGLLMDWLNRAYQRARPAETIGENGLQRGRRTRG